MGFDELNRLNDKNKGTAGGFTPGDMFEEVNIPGGIPDAADKIVDKFNEIKDWILKYKQPIIDAIALIGGAFVTWKVLDILSGLPSGLSGVGKAISTVASGLGLTNGKLLLIVAAIGLITAAVVHLQEKSFDVPNIMEGISSETKRLLEPYLELSDDAEETLKRLSWSGEKITEEMKDNLIFQYEEMRDQIISVLDSQESEVRRVLTELFVNSTNLSKEDKAQILADSLSAYEDKKKIIKDQSAEIQRLI